MSILDSVFRRGRRRQSLAVQEHSSDSEAAADIRAGNY